MMRLLQCQKQLRVFSITSGIAKHRGVKHLDFSEAIIRVVFSLVSRAITTISYILKCNITQTVHIIWETSPQLGMALIRNQLSILMGNLTTPSYQADFKILANYMQQSQLSVPADCQVLRVMVILAETDFTPKMRIGIHTTQYLVIKVLCVHLRRE